MKRLLKRAVLAVFALVALLVMVLASIVVFNRPLARSLYYKVDMVLHKDFYDHIYLGSSFAITNLTTGETNTYKEMTKPELPASLAKLFVVDFALTKLGPDEEVEISPLALSMQKEGSSSAHLVAGDVLTVQDLLYGALLPSGNDAAYALAIYTGSKIDPAAQSDEERYQAFMDALQSYTSEQGYLQTKFTDASGYDLDATTSAQDVTNLCLKLLQNPLFKEIVSHNEYATTSKKGISYSWSSTNQFMQQKSPYYSENVHGIKTGSLNGRYNLCIYFITDSGDPYLLVSFGSDSDERRYVDVQNLTRDLS